VYLIRLAVIEAVIPPTEAVHSAAQCATSTMRPTVRARHRLAQAVWFLAAVIALLTFTAREATAVDAAVHTAVDFVCGEQRAGYDTSSMEMSIANKPMSGMLTNVAPGTHNLRIRTSQPGWSVKEIKYLDIAGGRGVETYKPNTAEANLPLVFTARPSRSSTSSLNILIETCGSVAPSSACALTPQEQNLAAAAFLKLVPVLDHDRCALCHGRQDVFAKGTPHFGGRFFDEEAVIESRWSDCAECHDAAKNMTGPPEELQWRQAMTSVLKWGGTSPRQLCLAMKSSRLTSVEFIEHMKHDVRLRLAFEGKRGHVTLPAGLTPKPPPLTHANFVVAAQEWVNALGGEKSWRPEECGCETLAMTAPPGNVPPAQPASPPPPRNPAFEYDAYRSGGDYRSFELPTADPNLCAAQCAREVQCKAWTYLNPGVQANLARCWLKDAVSAPVTNVPFAISGVARGGAPASATPAIPPR
jgi:hypothetical protein